MTALSIAFMLLKTFWLLKTIKDFLQKMKVKYKIELSKKNYFIHLEISYNE